MMINQHQYNTLFGVLNGSNAPSHHQQQNSPDGKQSNLMHHQLHHPFSSQTTATSNDLPIVNGSNQHTMLQFHHTLGNNHHFSNSSSQSSTTTTTATNESSSQNPYSNLSNSASTNPPIHHPNSATTNNNLTLHHPIHNSIHQQQQLHHHHHHHQSQPPYHLPLDHLHHASQHHLNAAPRQQQLSNQLTLPLHLGSTTLSRSQHQNSPSATNNNNLNNLTSQQYNMNSDYSSSTYHIYDQISDLIIIKQQRMERKRQLEHRRKVILIAFAVTILIGTILFLLLQALSATNNANTSASGSILLQTQHQLQQQNGYPNESNDDNNNNNNNNNDDMMHAEQAPRPPSPPSLSSNWPTPPAGSRTSNNVIVDSFDVQSIQRLMPLIPSINNANNNPAISLSQSPCGHHGQLVLTADGQSDRGLMSAGASCKCEPGYWGERCELGGAFMPTQSNNNHLQAKCLRCHQNGGQCTPTGRCQCPPGLFGTSCESKASQTTGRPAMTATDIVQSSPNQQPRLTSNSFNFDCSQMGSQNCSSNGQCLPNGKCKCMPGFIGANCQERDACWGMTCLNQGTCIAINGAPQCQCRFGYTGSQCEIRDDLVWRRLFNCSNHGRYDYVERKCNCDQGYSGQDCSEQRCEDLSSAGNIDCGANGLYDCLQKRCICQDGFTGDRCQIQQCSAQCLRNGQCVDGSCVCKLGFFGKHCSFNGCPYNCSGRGQCVRLDTSNNLTSESQQQQPQAEWRCQCQSGASGDDCGQSNERQCDDGIDNDRDGLVDCADSECCSDKICQNSTLCMKSPDPLDILMRKQALPPTSSFFQRMQFLIEKFSSQFHSNPKDFNDSRASVIRGKVTFMKRGVTGVRVSVVGQTNLGMTLSRDGGYFDLMVNGGGAVVIELRREPFATYQRAVRVPWNEIVLVEPIELLLENSPSAQTSTSVVDSNRERSSCLAHSYTNLVPQIVSAPKAHWSKSYNSASKPENQHLSRTVILQDSAIVQHSIALPAGSYLNSNGPELNVNESQVVSLVYVSSRANEFMSTINLQLVPPAKADYKLPDELKLIHLKIVIEGNLFEQTFEPSNNLTFTYAWNRRNVYRQKCYGLSNALVSVGYEYFECKHVIWSTKQIQLSGYDLSISDIGQQWNLNIHHRYNYRDSILQRGDGQNFFLKTDKPKVVVPLIGDGYQRPPTCPSCDGAASFADQRLLKPQALISAPDGSIYIGDHNLIRRIESNLGSSSHGASQNQDRFVKTILELPANQVPSRYNLALNIADANKLYMTDPDRHQVYLIREQVNQGKQTANEMSGNRTQLWEDQLVPLVGSGIKCQPDDGTSCGDGQLARAARLLEPKSVAFDLSGRMYIADGHNIRLVDLDQRIYTLLGDYGQQSRHSKFPCTSEPIPMHKFSPKWPQDIAFNPVDDTLHILDDNVVYKVTADKRVQIVAGRLANCPLNGAGVNKSKITGHRFPRANEVFLQSAQSISFNLNGDLFISEDDQKSIARILVVSSIDDSIHLYAGLPTTEHPNPSHKLEPTIDTLHQLQMMIESSSNVEQQKASNLLQSSITSPPSSTRASDYKFNSIGAICVDQQGKLIVADRVQLRLLSIEPDLPQMNSMGEYEMQSPANADELLVFNRFGHHVATKDLGLMTRSTRFTFTYSVNTPFGQLASIQYGSGNRISIYRDGPHHTVKMIETSLGGQCKLDISRNGQVNSIAIISPNPTRANFSYQVLDGGLMKQSRDLASNEVFDFMYDEFGRAISIQNSSPRLPAPVECRLPNFSAHQSHHSQTSSLQHHQTHQHQLYGSSGAAKSLPPNSSPLCSDLVVA